MYKRSVDEPTLDDHINKAVLPKVMQVKKFGFAGRTKYTHLKDQDTSQVRACACFNLGVSANCQTHLFQRDTGWNQKTAVHERYAANIAGTKQVFERPEGQKRKRDT